MMDLTKREQLDSIDKLLDKLRPHMLADNGNIKVVDIKDGSVVLVKWLGACATCTRAELTLKYSVKEFVRENMPAITDVVAI